jgi:hypothetical protein
MLRRVLVVTGMALVVGAACAYAVSPRVSHMGLSFSRGLFGFDHGFTPTPPDSTRYATEGGAPGTYCPIPSRDSASTHKSGAGSNILGALPAQSTVTSAGAKSADSLLGPSQTKCDVPTSKPLIVP